MSELRQRKGVKGSGSSAISKPTGSGSGDHAHKFEYEFGGPVGAFATMMALPLVLYFLYYGATKDYRFNFTNYEGLFDAFPKSIDEVWSLEAFAVVCGWFAFNVFLERILFAEKGKGVVLRDGSQLTYNLSGHLQFWVILFVLMFGKPVFNEKGNVEYFTHFNLAWLYDNYVKLATGAVLFSWILSIFLYSKSFAKGALLALGGDSGNPVYDFFIGRELNPRTGKTFDWKEFCELRPGLIGWMVLNIGCAMKQYELLGYVTYPMIFINLFQGIYVWDALYQERAILTTMDITTDGFGWMLCFGDLAWVPFSYSLQARYIVENDSSDQMSTAVLAGIFTLNFVGYYIFRSANSQKDAFRRDPNSEEVAHLKTITTKTGRKLLVSGWWGLARKINYTGDWLMGLAWCSCTGHGCIVTYFYSIYFFILLVHRAYRDNHACAHKYGDDWPRYKAHVPYVFVPGVI
uniref:Delta(14)-sterol reductase n=1 Tax=Aplanochytrium stocchinoi TaxID=215587 RepID=A0A7S3LQD1_9STRA|mmetsp:Transcript_20312/g.24650  ORF Transcript_20312/g.24650 Transcript_20312/m.24650 type:complete len:461 (+) Transcript_20312:486-1868(+)|eukprot:CAMPEP_0204827110 /NCGR_PEP_ID=MMETSP1346-20131115/4661_1 /ASSEMBLY_ACC=CAM_ASM_000771 /TAXON_ID=215587 /ORGANISM="Aplanochytrium stocchinoi, Strain GSBS06" /LENGTH=460 /DNA_ID=CAMNT_0051955429 /DNA_START=428 /DNA_END=1810 /DNA_ORIENTATION=-